MRYPRSVSTLLGLLFATIPLHAANDLARLREALRDKEQEVTALRRQIAAEESPSAKSKEVTETASSPSEPPLEGRRGRARLGQLLLRQSVFDEKSIAEPAQFTYVRPASSAEVWSTDVGLALRSSPIQNTWSLTEFRIGAEYHRNTAMDELTEQFQTGLIAKSYLGEPGDWWGFNLDTRVSYKNDNVKDIQAISGALDVYPRWPWLATSTLLNAGFARWQWQPFVGVFFDETVDTAANVSAGHRLMTRGGAQLTVFPLFAVKSPLTEQLIETSLELAVTSTSWCRANATGVFRDDESSHYLTARLSYFFKDEKDPSGKGARNEALLSPLVEISHGLQVGLSFIYENGADPQLGLKDIDKFTVSLSASF